MRPVQNYINKLKLRASYGLAGNDRFYNDDGSQKRFAYITTIGTTEVELCDIAVGVCICRTAGETLCTIGHLVTVVVVALVVQQQCAYRVISESLVVGDISF